MDLLLVQILELVSKKNPVSLQYRRVAHYFPISNSFALDPPSGPADNMMTANPIRCEILHSRDSIQLKNGLPQRQSLFFVYCHLSQQSFEDSMKS